MTDRLGQQFGSYRLVSLLGQGGYAEVYLGQHIRFNQQAAIKVLHAHLTDQEAEHFQREAETIAKLAHPSIVRVLDFDVQEGVPFLVMDYAPNGSLRQRYPKGKLVPLPQIVSSVKQVADALQYAHEQKFIHRDVKPENMLLGRREEVLLSDFGIATIAHNTSSLNVGAEGASGTLAYMAPEQIEGHPRQASDQYALGIVVYEWLCGERPFEGSASEVMAQHLSVPPLPLHERVPTIPAEIEQVVLRALSKDPKARFASVAAFSSALEQASQRALAPTAQIASEQPALGAAAATNYDTVAGALNQQIPPKEMAPSADVPGEALEPTILPISSQPPAPTNANQPVQIQQPATSSLSQRARPSQPTSTNGKPHKLLFRNNIMRNFILVVLTILLIASVGAFALIRTRTPVATANHLPNGIGVTKAPDGEYIGISDGTFAFDTNRPDGHFKTQAADKLKAHDVSGAESLWQSGLSVDTNDAEALIYLEDQRVLTSGNPYITLVAGTIMTGDSIDVGRYDLQGAYIAQREFNNGHKLSNNLLVRLLIANSDNVATYTTEVAQQIVQVAQQDHTIVGVMGWPYSSHTLDAIGILARAHIPMVSQGASSDQLTGISSYFFRVDPSNKGEAIAGAKYAERVLHASNVALFVDPADSYSSSLASDFSQQFVADGNHIVITENYTVGPQGRDKLPNLLLDALSHNPDLIYFSGYYFDISMLLDKLPTIGPYASLQVLSGDAQCEAGSFTCTALANYTRLHFTKFAFADEWKHAGLKAQSPAFFNEYISAYNPNRRQPAGMFGYTRPTSDAMLSYDATLALFTASNLALKTQKSSLTPNDVLQGLRQIKGAHTLQGVSGPIAFDSNGDPINKPFVVLAVDAQARVYEERLYGCLLVGPCS